MKRKQNEKETEHVSSLVAFGSSCNRNGRQLAELANLITAATKAAREILDYYQVSGRVKSDADYGIHGCLEEGLHFVDNAQCSIDYAATELKQAAESIRCASECLTERIAETEVDEQRKTGDGLPDGYFRINRIIAGF